MDGGGLGKSSPVGLGNAQDVGGVCRGHAPSRSYGTFASHQAVFGYQIRSLLIRLIFTIIGVQKYDDYSKNLMPIGHITEDAGFMSEKRSEPKQIKFRVTEDEFERLTLMADNVGMSVPAFVKAKAQGMRVRQPKIDRQGALEIARELRRVGTNVNQIARWCNKRTEVSQEELQRLHVNLEEIKKRLEQGWQQLS
ncbi:hypothetical protein IGM_06742 [Bacillus cereus HuB4-4]|uniref:Bacterial mobilisation domain-containing protein n=2 Tax=Bacillus TaxID=1386 RepID=A0A9W5QMU3_BACCE|nr:hypothetical protein IGM_06742 [Bacillus cereus HuB4-4]